MASSKTEKQKPLTLVLSTVYLLALIWIILFKFQFFLPNTGEGRVLNLIPLMGSFDQNGNLDFNEIVINIMVFIPLGIFTCMLKPQWTFGKKFVALVGVTLAFEITQYIFAIGRADITDVLSNTLGGILGIGIFLLASKGLKHKTIRFFNGLATVFTVLFVLLISILMLSHHWVIIK